MADADEATAADAGSTPAGEARSRRRFALAFVAFFLLFGQPVAVFWFAVASPTPAVALVIVGGTVALAGPLARTFVRQGRSVGRLGDFLLALAAAQILLLVGTRLALAVANPDAVPDLLQPAVALAGYPIAYALVYRGTRVRPLGP